MRLQLIALLGAAAVASAACGTSSTPTATQTQTVTVTTTPASTTPETTATSAAPAATACDELKGTVNGFTCTVHKKSADYTIDMTFPADYPDQEAIVDLMNEQRDGFLDLIEDRPGPPNPYALDIIDKEYSSGDDESGTVSVVFEEYVNVGGAHPTTNYDALSYDLGKDAPITFDTLFKPGTDPVAVLDPIVKANFEEFLDGTDPGPNSIGADMYRSFAITDDDVIFFIGQGMWAFSAAGAREVPVPRSDIASILA